MKKNLIILDIDDTLTDSEDKHTESLLYGLAHGAALMVDYFLNQTDYAICFATGSIAKPAYLKLQQAGIAFIPELVATCNTIFERENIVKSAIEKAKNYFKVDDFKHIISFGDGLWDVTTAKNVNAHFVGMNDKNASDFEKMDVKYHIKDWTNFNLTYVEELFGISLQ